MDESCSNCKFGNSQSCRRYPPKDGSFEDIIEPSMTWCGEWKSCQKDKKF